MWVNLPDEIIPAILSRLPAKSLGRFKCVSKPWRTLISDPNFTKTHLSLTLNNRREKLLACSNQSLAVLDFDGGEPFVSSQKLNFKQRSCWYDIYGSCNGLILGQGLGNQLYLLNPTTLESKQIPNPPGFYPIFSHKSCGLGYESISDDYKVVAISPPNIVHVYSLKTNAWNRVEDSRFNQFFDNYVNIPGVFLNGCIHWFGSTRSSSLVIAAFDLADEKFREVPLPPITGFQCGLQVVGGFLCMTNHFDGNDLWVWKEYGLYESWTKFSVSSLSLGVKILFLVGDGEFILDIHGNAVSYNGKENTTRDVVVHGRSGQLHYKCNFVESLVSPSRILRCTRPGFC